MNKIQMISEQIASDRLKRRLGLNPDVDIDTLALQAMWRRLCADQENGVAANSDNRDTTS